MSQNRAISILLFTLIFSTISFSQTTIWSEDFEGNWFMDWYVDNGVWEVGTPTSGPDSAYAGNKCAATVLEGNYPVASDSRLIKVVPIEVPSASLNPRLRFWSWHSMSSGDFSEVNIKYDTLDWFPVTIQYDNNCSNVYSKSYIDLRQFEGKNIELSFYIHSHSAVVGSDEASGWYIDNISLEIGDYIFNQLEDFENGIGDWWTVEGTWEIGLLESGPDSPHSGSSCAGTNLSGNYSEVTDGCLVSPEFQVPEFNQNPRIRFWSWHSINQGDYGEIQINRMNGQSWESLPIKFTESGNNVWSQEYIDLRDYAGETIQVVFYFHSHSAVVGNDFSTGWYIDDFELRTGPFSFSNPEDFENGFGDWFSYTGVWEIGIPENGPQFAHSGSNCAGTNLKENYSEECDGKLIYPELQVPNFDENPRLEYWSWHSMNAGDYGEVQIKLSDSTEWQSVTQWYNDSGSDVWSKGYVDLLPYAGKIIDIAFYFKADGVIVGADVSSGWYIDDVKLKTGAYILNNPENFENLWGDWWSNEGTWEIGEVNYGPDTAYSGNICLGTNLNGNYHEVVDGVVYSPFFYIPANASFPRLIFWQWSNFNHSDFGVVVARTEHSWTELTDHFTQDSEIWTVYQIPLDQFKDSTISIGFYFQARSGVVGNDTDAGWYIDDIYFIGLPQTSTISTQSGWNLISVPLLADDMSPDSVLGIPSSQVFEFGNGYSQSDLLLNGKGYWAKFDDIYQIPVSGSQQSAGIPVSEGWNIIGPYDEKVNVNSIASQPSNIIAGEFYGFNTSYYIEDFELEPGKGYWIKTSSAGQLSFNNATVKKSNSPAPTEFIQITDNSGKSFNMYYGNKSLNRELPPTPPAGVADVRFLSNSDYFNLANGSETLILDNLEYPLTIINNGNNICITDALAGKFGTVELADNESLTISDNSVKQLTISSTMVPTEFTLHQNYPNPFNPVTNIKYALPEQAHVTLIIYNVLGEQVISLANEVMEPGIHEVSLNATNLASGVYIYKINAGRFTQSKKMILLK